MSKTFKDKPGYLNGIKKKKEELSEKYIRHRNRENEKWERHYEDRLSNESKYYKCIERKPAMFLDDFDVSEDLIDQMDSLNDKENDAA